MKFFSAILVFLCLASSCRKDRFCSCTIRETGTVATHSMTGGFPPFIPPSDTTVYSPYDNTGTLKTRYGKVAKKRMRDNCFEYSEEQINSSNTSESPGIYTITTTDNGKRTITCRIE